MSMKRNIYIFLFMSTIKKLLSVSWTTAISGLSTFVVRFALICLFGFLLVVIYRGLNEDGYKMQPLQVPLELEKAGYNGQVLTVMIQNRVEELKTIANSRRVDSLELNVDLRPDLNLDVMGVGLSASSMTYYLRELLGRTNNVIGGSLTDLEGVMTLNMRMTGYRSSTIDVPYDIDESRIGIRDIIDEGAKYILSNTDPYRLAICLDRLGDTDKAEEWIRYIIKNRPQDRKWAYHLWGGLKNRQGDKETAHMYYRKAIEQDEDFVLPYRALAWGIYEARDYEGALPLFLKALEINPNEKYMDTGAALCYREIGMLEEAGDHYRKYLEKYPDDLYGYGNYSDFLMRFENDTIGATKVWQDASQAIEESGDYYLALGAYQLSKGDSMAALQSGMQALDLDPNDVSVLIEMSKVFADVLKDYKESIKLSKRLIVALDEGQYDSWMRMNAYNRLAMAEYEIGAYDDAITHANKAIEVLPENAFPWSTLAEAYLLKGDVEEFYKAIEKSISLGFEIERYLDTNPYNKIKNKSRLMALRGRYSQEYALKG